MKPNRQKVHQKFGGYCAYCGISIEIKDMQVDHVIPQWKTTTKIPLATKNEVHCEENHFPACRSCNNYKSGNNLETFREGIQLQIERLRRDKPTFRIAERFGLIECKPKKVTFFFETLVNK